VIACLQDRLAIGHQYLKHRYDFAEIAASLVDVKYRPAHSEVNF